MNNPLKKKFNFAKMFAEAFCIIKKLEQFKYLLKKVHSYTITYIEKL